ncbi:MAG: hypothetical protein HY431_02060 [Candidatus Levybacteria bacterium]|nr:hypothetical protein [Candidatus Levybacteria bacterium]
MKLIHKLTAGLGILSLLAAITFPALAATDASVTATVTPGNISVTVSPSPVGYGTVGVPSLDNVPATPSADPIIEANNNGGIPETFNIKGANAIGTTQNWIISTGSPTGSPGYNYNHKFADCGVGDTTCSTIDAANTMDTNYETLETNIAAGASDYFKLRLSTPTETGGDTSEHSTTVTVQAVAF